ncbi:MAG: S8 family serine peptidase [Acidobacteriota bacterium]
MAISLLVPTTAVAGPSLGATAGSGAAPFAYWLRTDGSCGTQAPVQIACGDVGEYHIDTQAVMTVECGGGVGKGEPIETYPRPQLQGGPNWPCQNGSCFTPDDDAWREQRPFVAVIDWDDPHGWSVGAILAELVAATPRFDPLAASWPELPAVLSTAGDLHVLRQLCTMLDQPAAERPDFVNMSFGRFTDGDARCGTTSLRCEISMVLDELVKKGVTFFAAAGNDGEMMFPASAPAVSAVGALDLASFRGVGKIKPTPETPAGVDILMPGHGLALTLADGSVWGAPPGSSYASALATGWIADFSSSIVTDVKGLWEGRVLTIYDPGDETYRLGYATGAVPQSFSASAAALACNALGCSGESMAATPEAPRNRTIEIDGAGQLPSATFADIARDGQNRPSPGSRPCIPCHDIPDDVMATDPVPTKRMPGPVETASSHDDLQIDLSASDGVPQEYALRSILLRVGDQVYAFSDSNHEGLLADLAAGNVDSLRIPAAPPEVWTHHTALVWVLATTDGTEFWHATPVAIHGH